MDSNWAAERLEQIRLLMERSALYRRALAPIALTMGSIGLVAGGLGWQWEINGGRAFAVFWLSVAAVSSVATLLMIRRQALKSAEPFWSLPTRRVAEAMFPPFLVGLVVGLLALLPAPPSQTLSWWLPSVWMILYGCGLCSAGFFMPRGIKLFGFGFIVTGSASLLGLVHSTLEHQLPDLRQAHLVMGGSFGILHLFYGLYLYLTENAHSTP